MYFSYDADSKTVSLLDEGTNLLLEEYADLASLCEKLQVSVTIDPSVNTLTISKTGNTAESSAVRQLITFGN